MKTKRLIALTMTLCMAGAVAIGCVAAEGGNIETVAGDATAVAGSYVYNDLTLTLDEKLGYALSDGKDEVTGTFAFNQEENKWKGTITTVIFSEEEENKIKEKGFLADYWDGTAQLSEETFAPSLVLEECKVEYAVETVADENSATGYLTTLTVEDQGYRNVYAYGNWRSYSLELTDPSDETSYDKKGVSPTAWTNGMFYNGAEAIAMEKEDTIWTLTLPLASSDMHCACFADLLREGDAASYSINEAETFQVPYDPVKQSQSFDWSVLFYDEDIAGSIDTSVSFSVETAEGVHEINLAVYLPKEYAPDTQYPVIYFIPGGMTDYTSLFKGNEANSILDNMIANGEMEPVILVGIERTDSPYLVGDIVPYVEENYNVCADAGHRALYSVSMGAAAATTIWMDEEQSGTFGYYAFFSGADKETFAVDESELSELEETYLELLSAPTIFIGGGTDDFNMYDGDNNSASVKEMDIWMTHYGIDHGMEIVGGSHNGITWVQLFRTYFGEYVFR